VPLDAEDHEVGGAAIVFSAIPSLDSLPKGRVPAPTCDRFYGACFFTSAGRSRAHVKAPCPGTNVIA